MPDLRKPFDLRRLQAGLRDRSTGERVWDLLHDPGVTPVAVIAMATEPTATDTLTIGGDVYEFVATAGAVADDANIAVELEGAVADTRDNLVDAINAVNATNLHANITNIATTAPALANGTERILATEIGATVAIQYADGPGGAVNVGDPSILLGEALTDASDIWDVGDVNLNTLGGKDKTAREQISTSFVVTAAMITAGVIRVDLPWQPSQYSWSARLVTGEHRLTANDLVLAISTGLEVTLTGGGAPDIQATDILTLVAHE